MSKSRFPLVKPPPKNDVVRSEQDKQVLKTVVEWRPKEAQFRLFVESVQDYAIFMLDPSGHVCTWNSGAERIYDYKASEVIGRHFSCFYRDQDLRAGKPTRLLKLAAEKEQLRDEGWRVRKDGSIFWAIVTLTAVRDDAGNLIAFGKVTRDVTERMQAEESLREVSGDLLEAHEEERRRIGRDLHDSLGQTLAMMKINLDQIAAVTSSENSEVSLNVMQCVRLAEESIKEVRTISYLFYPPMLEEMGLKSAIPGTSKASRHVAE